MGNEKLKSSYKSLFLRWILFVNWLFKGFSREQIQEGRCFLEKNIQLSTSNTSSVPTKPNDLPANASSAPSH